MSEIGLVDVDWASQTEQLQVSGDGLAGVESTLPLIAAVELHIASRLGTLVWKVGVTLKQERELGPRERLGRLNKTRLLLTFSATQRGDPGRANFNGPQSTTWQEATWQSHHCRGWIRSMQLA